MWLSVSCYLYVYVTSCTPWPYRRGQQLGSVTGAPHHQQTGPGKFQVLHSLSIIMKEQFLLARH